MSNIFSIHKRPKLSKINSQSFEDTQVEYISQKYTFGKYTFVKHTFGKYTFEKWVGARDTCVSKKYLFGEVGVLRAFKGNSISFCVRYGLSTVPIVCPEYMSFNGDIFESRQ